ncbi:MAG: hypothetical protein V3T77_02985, partial [Planctomycetota bacterium]
YETVLFPHAHLPGLGCRNLGAADGSLVGELEFRMQRLCQGRLAGDPLTDADYLAGKMAYLAEQNPNWLLQHQDDGPIPGGGDFVSSGLTSVGFGSTPTMGFLLAALSRGSAVELGWTYSSPPDSGGHWVTVVGAGSFLDVPWIAYRSDRVQSDSDSTFPPDTRDNNEGTAEVTFSYLIDLDGNGLLNLVNEGGQPHVDFIVTALPLPRVPATSPAALVALFFVLAVAMGVVCSRYLRRPSLSRDAIAP